MAYLQEKIDSTPWLLLTFTLPVKRAAKGCRYGGNAAAWPVPLGNSGYLLPNGPPNQEKFE